MSTNRSAPGPAWYPNLTHWWADEEMARLSIPAQNLFMRLIALCHSLQTGGRLTMPQVLSVCHGFTRVKQVVDSLYAAGVLVVDDQYAAGTQAVGSQYAAGEQAVRIRCADKWLKVSNPPRTISADQSSALRANEKQAGQPRARVEREKEREKESIRSPSGSDRMDSARAAPRSAGGAARPAPVAGCWEGDTVDDDDPPKMTRAEAIAAAKTAIRNGQKKSPYSTGRDVTFSRYDPDRKIVPLTSGFKIDGGAE